jgi:hypothetical protein
VSRASRHAENQDAFAFHEGSIIAVWIERRESYTAMNFTDAG